MFAVLIAQFPKVFRKRQSRWESRKCIFIDILKPNCWYDNSRDKLGLCVYLSDTTLRWKMYVYLLHNMYVCMYVCNKYTYIHLPPYSCVRQVYTQSQFIFENTTGMTNLMIMTIAGFLQIPFKCQPSYFLDMLLLHTRNNSTPSSRYNWECGRNPPVRRAGGYVDRWKTPPLILQHWFLGISQWGT